MPKERSMFVRNRNRNTTKADPCNTGSVLLLRSRRICATRVCRMGAAALLADRSSLFARFFVGFLLAMRGLVVVGVGAESDEMIAPLGEWLPRPPVS